MPNPGAFLSAHASASALRGGNAPAGAGPNTVAANGGYSADFSALLSGPAAFAAVKASRAKPSAATDSGSQDAAQAPAPAPSGKGLPLAALAAAVLPVPITLAALVDKPTTQDTAATAQEDDANATGCAPLAAQNTALAMMAQNTGTATVAANGKPAKGLTPATYQAKAADTALAQPGFTLLPKGAATALASLAAEPLPLDSAQQAVTISAHAAAAMADPAALRTLEAQPGFTLLDASGPDGATATASLANAGAPVTLKPDTAVAMAEASYVPANGVPATGAHPGFTLPVSADAPNAASAPMQAPNAVAPGFSSIQLAQADGTAVTQSASDQAAPAKLASARAATVQGISSRSSARGATGADTQDQTASDEPSYPPASGASSPDHAPNALSPASAGTAAAQTLAASNGATPPVTSLSTAVATNTQPATNARTDMAALVDRLVEARTAARSGLGAQSVQASVTHADFGRVSLRFDQDDKGMSISMTSRDPGFAPAAQAALAQAPGVAASAQGHGSGPGAGQQGSGQPGQQWAQAGASSGGGQSGTGGQNTQQGSQNGAPQGQTDPARQARAAATAAATSSDTGAHRHSGILA